MRGLDATGAFSVGKDNTVERARALGTPELLMDTRQFNNKVDRFNTKVLVGHCRAKTMGQNTVQNAHPFQHGAITGVHNGTLRNWRAFESNHGFDVDSSWLYNEIAENGIEDVIPRVDGAWCLNWWDSEENSLNFLRNDERPLSFCWSEDKETMFWASEAWMLGAVSRKIKVSTFDDGTYTRSLAVDEFWSFKVNEGKDMFVAKPVKKIEGGKSAPFRYAPGKTGGSNNVVDFRKGGSGVTSPFLPKSPTAGGALDDSVEDIGRPPLVTKDGTPLVRTNTAITSAGGSSCSSSVSASSTGQKHGASSSRKTLSLPAPNSQTSHTTSKSESCVSSDGSSRKKEFNRRVSFRTISGLTYITDNKTGTEYVEHVARVNTDNFTCCWHKKPVEMAEVSAFITPHKIICTDCNSDE